MKGQTRPHGGQEQPGRRSKPGSAAPRTRLAMVVARLAEVLDIDLLEAALGVSAPMLQDMLSGRAREQESKFAAHIWHQVAEAKLPESWLNNPATPFPQESVIPLRAIAAQSPKKSAIRRFNFKQLVSAFEGRLDSLADALELSESSVVEISTGSLLFDDQRFGHINPRLVAAGFADGWLEQPDATVTAQLIENLIAQASAAYEPDDQRYARSTSTPEPESLDTAEVASKPIKQPSQPDEANPQAMRPDDTAASKPEIAMKTQPSTAPSPVEPAASGQPQFKAAGIPGLMGASLPLQPRAEGSKPTIPRGAFASGRSLGTSAGTAKPATKRAAAVPHVMAPAQSQLASEAGDASKGSATDNQAREVSLRRTQALEQLLDTARRGAKVTLWRDLLKSSLGYWGNIRRGQVFLRDKLANDITAALGLPNGWLDDPVFPPPTIADWVLNADVPLPGAQAAAATLKKERAPKTDTAVTAKAAVPASQPAGPEADAPPPALATLEPEPVSAEPQASEPLASTADAPTPEANQAHQGTYLEWEPSTSPKPVQDLGPLVTALVAVIQDLATQGKFSEHDALKLLNGFMAKNR